MESFRKYNGIKYSGDAVADVEDYILIEKPLRIVINDEPFTVTMRTPNDDYDLVKGLLYAEDIFEKTATPSYQFQAAHKDCLDTMYVTIDDAQLKDGYKSARNFLSLSSCGICGKTDLPKLEGKLKKNASIELTKLLKGFMEMKDYQKNFQKTGGSHAVALLNSKGEIILVREDIGRHNAVDKCVGAMLNSDQIDRASAMLVSGRISYEIIIKTFRAKISTLAAISAPSSLSIDYAKELKISLYAFCRNGKLTKYS